MRDHRTELLGLMWGNLLLVRWEDLWPLFAAWLVPLAFAVFFAMKSRQCCLIARSAWPVGYRPRFPTRLLRFAFRHCRYGQSQYRGGLMLFSLLTHPAAAVMQLARRTRDVVVLDGVGSGGAVERAVSLYMDCRQVPASCWSPFPVCYVGLVPWIQSLMKRMQMPRTSYFNRVVRE